MSDFEIFTSLNDSLSEEEKRNFKLPTKFKNEILKKFKLVIIFIFRQNTLKFFQKFRQKN